MGPTIYSKGYFLIMCTNKHQNYKHKHKHKESHKEAIIITCRDVDDSVTVLERKLACCFVDIINIIEGCCLVLKQIFSKRKAK